MKIAIVGLNTYASPAYGYGGETYTYHISRAFAALGHEVTHFAAPGSRSDGSFKLCYIPGGYGNILHWGEAQVVDQYREELFASDLIVDFSHTKLPSEEAYWFRHEDTRRFILVPCGVVSHIPRCPPYNLVVGSQQWRELLTYGRSQFYKCANPWWGRIYGETIEPTPADAIAAVIPWGVPVDWYTPAPPSEKEDWFLWLGRPTAYKGMAPVMWLAGEMKLRMKMIIGLGHPSHQQELKEQMFLIEEARAKGATIEIVHIPDGLKHHEVKAALIRKARALIFFPQYQEAFGMTTVEALASGLPVIASTQGAMPEIIKEGVTGFLCQEPQGMIEAVEKVGQIDPEACRADAVKRYSMEVVAQQYIDLMPRLQVAPWREAHFVTAY